jgi:HEPN domain-containing protein
MNEPHIEAQRWLRQAQADLAVVRTLRTAGHHAAACFHSQQAAEKALKAVIFAHGARVVLGHSVRELARQCEAYDAIFAGMADGAALLDPFYITTRDPNGLPSPAVPGEAFTNAQAHTAQESAEYIISVVEIYFRTHMDISG